MAPSLSDGLPIQNYQPKWRNSDLRNSLVPGGSAGNHTYSYGVAMPDAIINYVGFYVEGLTINQDHWRSIFKSRLQKQYEADCTSHYNGRNNYILRANKLWCEGRSKFCTPIH
jgi:hypothetical protein